MTIDLRVKLGMFTWGTSEGVSGKTETPLGRSHRPVHDTMAGDVSPSCEPQPDSRESYSAEVTDTFTPICLYQSRCVAKYDP